MQCPSPNPYEGIGPCEDWDGPRQYQGYGWLYVNGKRWVAHRWVFFQAHGYLPEVVRHRCDRPPCVRLSHLLPGTAGDNNRDTVTRGRARRAMGLDHGNAKLSDDQVAAIRAQYPGRTQRSLAREYGVTQPHISNIVRRVRRGPTGVYRLPSGEVSPDTEAG